MSNVGRK